jgi:acyl carrier protein
MEEKLINFVAKVLEINSQKLSLTSTIQDIPEWDSFAHVLLIAEIEREFSIIIPLSKIFEIKKIGDFLILIHEKN